MKNRMMILTAVLFAAQASADVRLFTDRGDHQVGPLTEEFEQLTGEKVVVTRASFKELKRRIQNGAPADVIFTKDLVYLHSMVASNLLIPMSSAVTSQVANQMRHPNHLWTAVTMRARTLVYNPATIDASSIRTYKDLADPEWVGALCLRTSKSSYNQALVSDLILKYGRNTAESILRGYMNNLAQPVYGNDRAILRAIAQGECDVGITNSYYLGMAVAQNPNFPVEIKFLDQQTNGVHTNGTGAGIVRGAQNVTGAQKFINFLLRESSQLHLSSLHFDYPARRGLLPNTHVVNWGTFETSVNDWSAIGEGLDDANDMVRTVGYE